jgi:tetratricopeptide (TPR) repeat protein
MSRNTVTRLVQIVQPSGVEMNARLVLDNKPTRQETKRKTLSKYVQQYPQGWKKRLELAELLYSMGHWKQAVEEYRQVLERQPRLVEVRLQLGKILHLMGRETEAIEAYEAALFMARNEATHHHIAGAIASCRQDYRAAVKAFESAASQEPNNTAHWLALGQIHLDNEAPVAALQAFDAILALNPDDIVALIHSYDVLLAVGRVREAWWRVSRAIDLAPDDLPTLKRLIERRCQMGLVWGEEGKQTRQLIRAALQLAPYAADIFKSQAYYHIFRGEWTKGVAVLQQFTEEHPNNPSGWHHYAYCLFHTGNSPMAAETMMKAYALYPKDCGIYRALCEIRSDAGKLAELKPMMEEMLERFPQRWSVWVTAGRVLVENFKDIERGCTVSAKAIQLQPQLADAWFRHGRVLALAGRHQEAVEALEQGWQLWPEAGVDLRSLFATMCLGDSYQALGDDVSSRRWWEEVGNRARELMDFNSATAHYWQGRAFERLGDVTGAMQAYQTALSQHLLYPACGEVKEALKRLQSLI